MTTCAVVICTYTERRRAELLRAVDSIVGQATSATETVVVVDHDEALRERLAADLAARGARVVANRYGRGLSGARNSGIDAVASEVVAFLDDDAAAAPDWLAHLLAAYDAPEVLGVGGRIEPDWVTGRPAGMPPEFDWVVGCTYRGMPIGRRDVRNLIGANMSFRRSVFERVGGFSAALGRYGTVPLGCEETELCVRAARSLGGRLVYEPAALVRHRVPADRGTAGYFLSRCWAEGLSKARVAQLHGAGPALSTERRYATRVLPGAVGRGLADFAVRRDAAGLTRAGAIIAGLGTTAAGYAAGRLSAR